MPPTPPIPGLTHHPSLPYKEHATRLQTLDIWTPNRQLPPHTEKENATWIIYVHGGAWRDPTQDSLCVLPTLRRLASSHPEALPSAHIAGIASLNYRLSPYPSHATDPSTPADEDRNVAHPAHVADVCAALAFLRKEWGVRRWVGVGHSCGATLLLQATQTHAEGLEGLVLLAGIYDIPAFVENHASPADIARVYRDIVTGAFGAERSVWEAASPANAEEGKLAGRYVVLGWGDGDVLVERAQRDAMVEKYLAEGWVEGKKVEEGKGVVERRDLVGGHDEVWEEGGQIAGLIEEVVQKLRVGKE